MNWEAIGAAGQVLGSLAVFASLGYLAVQTKASAFATKHASQNAFVSDYNQFLVTMRTEPGLLELLASGLHEGFDALDPKSQERLHLFMSQQYLASKNMWLQMKVGQFESLLAEPLIAFFASQLRAKGGQEWWAMTKRWGTDEFTRHIDSLLNDPNLPTLEQLQPWWRTLAAR